MSDSATLEVNEVETGAAEATAAALPPAKKRGRPKKAAAEIEESMSAESMSAASPAINGHELTGFDGYQTQSHNDGPELSFIPESHVGAVWNPVSETKYSWGTVRTEVSRFSPIPYAGATNRRSLLVRTIVVSIFGSVATSVEMVDNADIYDAVTGAAFSSESSLVGEDGQPKRVCIFKCI